jgi:hypothetical protein
MLATVITITFPVSAPEIYYGLIRPGYFNSDPKLHTTAPFPVSACTGFIVIAATTADDRTSPINNRIVILP